ncbi:cytochrome D1 domain-containing protein [Seonamhaeicola sp. ML3]|uniref:cytochrome D1 domain-containing protein n=1 Tax=Seonamhaeicola sp. ML3 TaxID=2937786 RepID=UPI00200CECC7|nr:cytochrome D1 domain-containing protein [Seonamhaeicola sp. ML3]
MKKLRVLVAIAILLFSIIAIAFIKARTTSYSIETTGKLFIVNKLSSNVTVFDLTKGEQVAILPIDMEPHEATTSFYGDKVIVTNYGGPEEMGKSLTVIDAKTFKEVRRVRVDESLKPHGVVAVPNSNCVAVATDVGNDLLVIDIEVGQIKKKIPTTQIYSHLLTYHPTDSIAYVSNLSSGSVTVIDTNKDEVVKVIPCGKGTEGIDITPDGEEIWVTNNRDETISIINTKTLEIVSVLTAGEEPSRLQFTLDGKYCLVANSVSGTISVYNTATKKLQKNIVLPGKKNIVERILYHTPRPVCIAMHPNGKYAFVANSNAVRVEVIDLNSLKVVSTIGTGRIPDGLAIAL